MRNKIILSGSIFLLSFILFASNAYSQVNADVIIASNYNGFGVSCNGASDGSAEVIATGGVIPYEFLWSNGGTNQQEFGLSAGQYFITVTDAVFSQIVVEAFLTEPTPLNASITQNSIADLEAVVLGGMPPYNYLWTTGSSDILITNLSSGNYAVTITDSNGCTSIADYNLNPQTTLYPDWEVIVTNENHSIIIPDTLVFTINGDTAEQGDLLGVFYDSLGILKCGGYVTWTGITTAIVAYGNDPLTPAIDGFDPGQEFIWKVWDISEEEEFLAIPEYNLVSFLNDGHYFTNGISGLTGIIAYSEQEISIPTGWSIMSTYIDPFSTNLEDFFSNLTQDIIVVKNEDGLLYYPPWGLNMIGDMVIGEGYQIKMVDNGGLKSGFFLYVDGNRVDPATGIELPEGWSIISYLHKEQYPIEDMLASIDTAIVIVKDGLGQVYIPNPPAGPAINQIIDMKPGKGYKIKILAGNNVILYYPDSLPGGGIKTNPMIYPEHKYYAEVINTGVNHSFIFTPNAISADLKKGDEVGLFANNTLIGSKVFMGNDLAIAAFGNDEFTIAMDGALEDEVISIKVWKSYEEKEYTMENISWIEGDSNYETDKISIIDNFDLLAPVLVDEYISVYPNPNNGFFNILGNINGKIEKFELYSSEGKLVYIEKDINNLQSSYDFSQLPAGIYNINITTKESTLVEQLIIQ